MPVFALRRQRRRFPTPEPTVRPPWRGQSLHVRQILKTTNLQPKLKIGAPDDEYEREADRVADRVFRGEPIGPLSGTPEQPRRQCAACEAEEEETLRRQPVEEEKEEVILGKSDSGHTPALTPELASLIEVVRRGGLPMPRTKRAFFEMRFGRDFSQVKIHNDSKAVRISQAINARAFTIGQDVVFGAGQYAPDSSSGRRLLAHELTHVVQQSHSDSLRVQREEGLPGEIPFQSSVGTFTIRAREDGRIEFVVGTPELPVVGTPGAGFRCENGSCVPIIAPSAGIGGLGDTYTPGEALALLSGNDPGSASPVLGPCAPGQRNALGICCPAGMLAEGLDCVPISLPPGVLSPPAAPEAGETGGPSLTLPEFGESRRPERFHPMLLGSTVIDGFGFSEHEVPEAGRAELTELASTLRFLHAMFPDGWVFVTGHTDAVGSEGDNEVLGQQRAAAAEEVLVAAGVPEYIIIADSAGESRPAVDVETEEPRNRRVHVRFRRISSRLFPGGLR